MTAGPQASVPAGPGTQVSAATRTQLAHLAGPGFARLWQRARAALERSGGEIGTASVTLRDPSDTERAAIAGLLGRHRRAGAVLHLRLDQLDRALRTGPSGLGLAAVLEALGGTLRNRPAEAVAAAEAVAGALAAARAGPLAAEPWYERWLDGLARDGTLTRLRGAGELRLVPLAGQVLERLPADGMPLAVLAADCTGSTKALGRGTLAGLVTRALAERVGVPRPAGAAERRALWERFGVVSDDLASQVLVLNLRLDGTSPLAGWLAGAAAEGTPFRVTLQQLTAYPDAAVAAEVFVCENPAVLRLAAERLGPRSAPLVCAEGMPSVAFDRLAGRVRAAGGGLAYHGDFDWPGMRIAAAVIARQGARPWRLGRPDYELALAGSAPDDLVDLEGPAAPTPWDGGLAQAMRQAGKAVYEEAEAVSRRLLRDLAAPR